jgi:subtilisin family serine protease
MMGMNYRYSLMLCMILVFFLVVMQTAGADEQISEHPLITTIAIPTQGVVSADSPVFPPVTLPSVQKGGVQPGTRTGEAPIQVTTEAAPDRIIVKYKSDTMSAMTALPSVMATANAEAGASVMTDYSAGGIPGMQVVKVQGKSVNEAIQEYEKNPSVLYAEPDYLISLYPENPVMVAATGENLAIAAARVPNDPEFSLQWGMKNSGQAPFYGTSGADIRAPDAWGRTSGSSSVVIAVVDTGVDYTHPDLAANIWRNNGEIANNGVDDDRNGYIDDVKGWNFVSRNNDPMDDNGHGTHCAGSIAAVGNNNIGITGLCWNARIMPLKFLSSSGNGYVSDAISAILYANRKGAHVISNSWGGTQYTQALKDAIDASPAVVVCAAGNSGKNTDTNPQYPSSYTSSNIISVAATDYTDKLAGFSNYGSSSVDVAAPGVTIRSTYKGSQYQYLSGTSMATPYVSGLAGLLKAANPGMSNSRIKSQILSTVDSISSLYGKVGTGGRINAAKALGSSSVSPTPTYTPSPTPTQMPGILKASFIASPLLGRTPLTVQFRDISTGNPTSWAWNFGDGGYSYSKNPQHIFRKSGAYSVRLTISGSGRMSTIYKSRLIRAY